MAEARGFRDALGRHWKIRISLRTLARVKADTGYRLTDMLDPESEQFAALTADPQVIAEVLGSLISEQCRDRGIDPQDVLDEMTGEHLDAAHRAIVEALCDFFPREKGELVRRIVMHSIDETAKKQLAVLQEVAESITGESSGSTPHSPESDQTQTSSATS